MYHTQSTATSCKSFWLLHPHKHNGTGSEWLNLHRYRYLAITFRHLMNVDSTEDHNGGYERYRSSQFGVHKWKGIISFNRLDT